MSDNILLLTEDGNYLTAENGDYLIVVVQYLITAEPGAYSITGNDAIIDYVAQTGVDQYYIELRSFTERRRL
jgi:hypothetical protein